MGAPLGHPSFVQAFLVKKIEDQRILMDKILLFTDLQASWLLLLHCAATRANYLLRVVELGQRATPVVTTKVYGIAYAPSCDERRSNHAFGSRRDWIAKRNAHKETRILGQRGRFAAHDSCSSQGSGFPVRGCSGARRRRSMFDGSC